jgi:hypothetical protein
MKWLYTNGTWYRPGASMTVLLMSLAQSWMAALI